jgi:hypothetical protein
MCNKCKGFSERLSINSSREYLDFVHQLDKLVAAGTFRLIRGCPLKKLLEHQQWPSDVVTHIFECSNCGQRFRLAVDTYHGSGGTWEMMITAGSTEIKYRLLEPGTFTSVFLNSSKEVCAMSVFRGLHQKKQFDSVREYDEFRRMLQQTIDRGFVEEMTPINPNPLGEEYWFRDKETGEIFTLTPPDFPSRGSWNQVNVFDHFSGPTQNKPC